MADVEVGSFLSSGIDSSYMAACLAKENPAIKTFTVGFAEYEGERDEISWARELADELGIENSSKHIGEEEYWASLPRVQWHMDEPSADPSAVALYCVDQEAAKRVKAVLSGEGADEFFGGYRIYQTPFANAKLSWAPKGLLKGASKAARALGVRGANYLERASERPEDWYYTNANGVAFSPAERDRLRAGKRADAAARVPSPQELIAPAYAEVAGLDDTTRMQYVDLFFWLVGDILLKTDKMSMAHSLESRVPFLDKQVFGVSATIPTRLKANGEQTKLTLREAAERAIPKEMCIRDSRPACAARLVCNGEKEEEMTEQNGGGKAALVGASLAAIAAGAGYGAGGAVCQIVAGFGFDIGHIVVIEFLVGALVLGVLSCTKYRTWPTGKELVQLIGLGLAS